MNIEQLTRAKEIEKEITELLGYKRLLNDDCRRTGVCLVVTGVPSGEQYQDSKQFPSGNYLGELIDTEMDFFVSILQQKLEKRIKALEKEFSTI